MRCEILTVAKSGQDADGRFVQADGSVVIRKGGQVAVLAVISDGWPEPATATRRFRLLQPQAGAVIRVPFVPALRAADDPDQVPLPRRVRRALSMIQAATGRNPICPHQEA